MVYLLKRIQEITPEPKELDCFIPLQCLEPLSKRISENPCASVAPVRVRIQTTETIPALRKRMTVTGKLILPAISVIPRPARWLTPGAAKGHRLPEKVCGSHAIKPAQHFAARINANQIEAIRIFLCVLISSGSN